MSPQRWDRRLLVAQRRISPTASGCEIRGCDCRTRVCHQDATFAICASSEVGEIPRAGGVSEGVEKVGVRPVWGVDVVDHCEARSLSLTASLRALVDFTLAERQ